MTSEARVRRFSIAAVTAFLILGCEAAPAAPTSPATAVEACRPANATGKAGEALGFAAGPAVTVQAGATSYLLFIAGENKLFCETSQDASGAFTSTATALGRLDPVPRPELTYDGGSERQAPSIGVVLYGRVPLKTATVRVQGASGAEADAKVANGFYLVELTGESSVTRIVAVAVDGTLLGVLHDDAGLMPAQSALATAP